MSDQEPRPEPFRLMDSTLTVLAVGLVSQTLRELRDHVALAPPNSITHHFHGSLLSPGFDDPEYRNDFALWARRQMHDVILAERLGVLDALDFPDVEQLRQALLDVLDDRLAELDAVPQVPRGSEFHFQSSQLIVFDTGVAFDTPQALARGVRSFTPGSVYYHFIEARRRPPLRIDDYSHWLADWGAAAEPAVHRLEAIDPIFWSLTELRELIAKSLELVPQAEPVS
jgi:hypothetical protein